MVTTVLITRSAFVAPHRTLYRFRLPLLRTHVPYVFGLPRLHTRLRLLGWLHTVAPRYTLDYYGLLQVMPFTRSTFAFTVTAHTLRRFTHRTHHGYGSAVTVPQFSCVHLHGLPRFALYAPVRFWFTVTLRCPYIRFAVTLVAILRACAVTGPFIRIPTVLLVGITVGAHTHVACCYYRIAGYGLFCRLLRLARLPPAFVRLPLQLPAFRFAIRLPYLPAYHTAALPAGCIGCSYGSGYAIAPACGCYTHRLPRLRSRFTAVHRLVLLLRLGSHTTRLLHHVPVLWFCVVTWFTVTVTRLRHTVYYTPVTSPLPFCYTHVWLRFTVTQLRLRTHRYGSRSLRGCYHTRFTVYYAIPLVAVWLRLPFTQLPRYRLPAVAGSTPPYRFPVTGSRYVYGYHARTYHLRRLRWLWIRLRFRFHRSRCVTPVVYGYSGLLPPHLYGCLVTGSFYLPRLFAVLRSFYRYAVHVPAVIPFTYTFLVGYCRSRSGLLPFTRTFATTRVTYITAGCYTRGCPAGYLPAVLRFRLYRYVRSARLYTRFCGWFITTWFTFFLAADAVCVYRYTFTRLRLRCHLVAVRHGCAHYLSRTVTVHARLVAVTVLRFPATTVPYTFVRLHHTLRYAATVHHLFLPVTGYVLLAVTRLLHCWFYTTRFTLPVLPYTHHAHTGCHVDPTHLPLHLVHVACVLRLRAFYARSHALHRSVPLQFCSSVPAFTCLLVLGSGLPAFSPLPRTYRYTRLHAYCGLLRRLRLPCRFRFAHVLPLPACVHHVWIRVWITRSRCTVGLLPLVATRTFMVVTLLRFCLLVVVWFATFPAFSCRHSSLHLRLYRSFTHTLPALYGYTVYYTVLVTVATRFIYARGSTAVRGCYHLPTHFTFTVTLLPFGLPFRVTAVYFAHLLVRLHHAFTVTAVPGSLRLHTLPHCLRFCVLIQRLRSAIPTVRYPSGLLRYVQFYTVYVTHVTRLYTFYVYVYTRYTALRFACHFVYAVTFTFGWFVRYRVYVGCGYAVTVAATTTCWIAVLCGLVHAATLFATRRHTCRLLPVVVWFVAVRFAHVATAAARGFCCCVARTRYTFGCTCVGSTYLPPLRSDSHSSWITHYLRYGCWVRTCVLRFAFGSAAYVCARGLVGYHTHTTLLDSAGSHSARATRIWFAAQFCHLPFAGSCCRCTRTGCRSHTGCRCVSFARFAVVFFFCLCGWLRFLPAPQLPRAHGCYRFTHTCSTVYLLVRCGLPAFTHLLRTGLPHTAQHTHHTI